MKSTILIIDDELPTLELLQILLEAYGYNVLAAENGEAGLQLFKEHHPNLVLTDIKMPGIDGLEVLKRIKELNPHAEVIVITGHGDMELAIQALNLDATDFINKPVERQDLDKALKRAQERMQFLSAKDEQAISVQVMGGVAVITINGNVSSSSEPFVREAYNKAVDSGKSRIVFQFNESTSINGAGIAVLTQVMLDAVDKHRTLAITGLSDNFLKVLEIVGATKLAAIFPTLEDALAPQGH